MSELVKVVATLARLSGIDKDAVQNTFYFEGEVGAFTLADATSCLTSFYNGKAAAGSSANLAYWYSACMSRATNANSFKVTTIDPVTGFQESIIGEAQWTLGQMAGGSPGTGSYPPEIAIAATYHGLKTAEIGPNDTRPMSRRRGRIYLGPLIIGVGAEDASTKEIRVVSTLRNTAAAAMHELHADAAAAGGTWVVHSKTSGTTWEVLGGWVDDAWDVQRRRGNLPTVKTTWAPD